MKKIMRFSQALISLLMLFNLAMPAQAQKQAPVSCYGKASYNGLTDNEFLKDWWVAGPVKMNTSAGLPDDKAQKEFFDKEILTSVAVDPKKCFQPLKTADSLINWRLISYSDDIINFDDIFKPHDYAAAYLLAEIKMEAPARILLGVGSDDGVKIYINGKLVHSNWIGRGTVVDDDLVTVDLNKGSNQVLVKVQNMTMGWSFAMRKIGSSTVNKLLIRAAGNGDLDQVKLLMNNGADVKYHNESGLSAYQRAMIGGRSGVMDFLKEKGAAADEPMPPFEKLADGLFKIYDKGVMPGVSVLVSKNGEIVYAKGFGYADVGNKVPITPDTKFKIGSISKQFTASAILKLQEQGKLSLDDKLTRYIPGFPRGDEVTIRHLLNHTSGIHPYTDRATNVHFAAIPISIEALVDTIKAFPYDFSPGERYQYNNSGFVLLGYIVEKVSGKSLSDYLSETFFKPLDMNSTGIYTESPVLSNEAYGYAYNNGKLEKASYMDMSWTGGAGAIYSTVNDLYKWNEALFNGKVLTAESLKAAFAKTVLNNGKPVDYGFGWALSEVRGVNFISHGGSVFGFLSDLERQPESRANIIVLSNSLPPSPEAEVPGMYANSLAQFLLWQNMNKQSVTDAQIKPDETALKSFVGRYSYGRGAVLIVTAQGDQLIAQLTGQPAYPIFASGKDEFSWKVVEASVTFMKDDKGIVTHLIHRQAGNVIDAPKLPEETPVEVNPSLFDGLAGKYQFAGSPVIQVMRSGDQLQAQYTGLPPYRLWPVSETEYFVREMNIRLKFHLADNGKADSFLLNIDGEEKNAVRLPD